MQEKCLFIVGTAVFIAAVYAAAMCAVPGKGWLRIAETCCTGMILCYLCSLLLKPFGIQTANSPLAALTAGWLGLPGAAFAVFLAHWP